MTATRDPRRLFTEQDRRIVYANQDGRCGGTCDEALPDRFEMHHKIEWSRGGPTVLSNAVALCIDCHRNVQPADFDGRTPRQWQVDALAAVLPLLRQGQTATVSAAPGAGKTLFTAFAIKALYASDTIDRVVIFVPNNVLKRQWATSLAEIGLYIDDDAGRRGVENADSFVGVVHTYQFLAQGAPVLEPLNRRATTSRTLYVFDEVHHLAEAEHSAWGLHAASLVGSDPAAPRHPVLNLSGTLFRSAPGQKIGTVHYEPVPGMNRVQALADYVVSTADLVNAVPPSLRHVSLWQFDSTLEVVDLEASTTFTGGVVDLSEQEKPVRTAALRHLLRDDTYLRPMLTDLKSKLFEQYELLDGHPVKGLVVCDTQEHARQVHGVLADIMGRAPFLAVSEDGADALRQIRAFQNTGHMAVMVTVRMVTEGFDCPDIVTLVHLTPWKAELFINQMVARAMRITDTERRLDKIIPAAVLIPRDAQIRDAYNRVLADIMRLVDLPKVCAHCGQAPCICPREGAGRAEPREFSVSVLEAAELAGLSHDGDELDFMAYDPLSAALAQRGVPHIYHPGVAVVLADRAATMRERPGGATSRAATLREEMSVHSETIDRAAGWWKFNGDCDVAIFQQRVNDWMAVSTGERHWATLAQWERGSSYARRMVAARCAAADLSTPRWAATKENS